MTCKHLQELFALCERYNLKITGAELVRIVCPTCGVDEVCPNVLTEEYERRHGEVSSEETAPPQPQGSSTATPSP
ncbi:hypothetical protein THTE_2849 [Thermogutta terrifontis]|jgi:hypothetical protein|uniref:Uncharacterized protein n=1 Tax=Thermogutta terrifontis TaxID=1331910 RepID=A0A286RHJ9_9BACT|nr:hypothetical protein [Thermogutta terrifontis]ASV75451.1 hypothetical protein THTE_2849 [Thermogutta terrifontis]